MKVFRNAYGHEAGRTVTVGEMKTALDEYPDDMPIMAEWEGVNAYVDPSEFGMELVSKGMDEDEEVCLVMPVENY